ncbi:uncharacterized protein KZ484_009058 isoform 1-T2 [Pholidichthys leucotaenia]
MFAEMTPNHSLAISRKGVEENCCKLFRQHKHRTEKVQISQLRPKSPCIRTRLKFCFKERTRMEAVGAPKGEGAEGKLRELASKWFLETQVPLIVKNGLFPTWFLGFISRKDAEEILREKELGCFLIRLSNKAIGYILSYRGSDRCRHFVINQSETGQFVVCGDTEGHNTVPDLIEYYRTTPIEPFGEYLTSSCFEAVDEELYDMIQVSPKEKPAVTVRAVNVQKRQINPPQQPARPRKSNRTQEEVPPLPRRSRHLESSPLSDQDGVFYAQLRKQSPREIPRAVHSFQDTSPGLTPGRTERTAPKDQTTVRYSPPSQLDGVYSEPTLLDSKSRSLPLLDISADGEQSYRLNAPPDTPPRLSPKPVRQTSGNAQQSEGTGLCSRPGSSYNLDYLNGSPVYHLAGRPGSPHTTSPDARSLKSEEKSIYAEVSGNSAAESAYELIPNHGDATKAQAKSNTYEPLEDMRQTHNPSSWGFKNDKWKRIFPEAKRKW